jgi:transcription elongation GreA/GreB family factor
MTFKEKIYHHYLQIINHKVSLLQQVLADLKESASNETKSTAGDKHETALAMIQIEQANKRDQLKAMELQKVALEKIDPKISTNIITNGSLVKTNKGYLYMSIALSKAVIEDTTITALSPQSPLGSLLKGLTVGEIATINNTIYRIESIE